MKASKASAVTLSPPLFVSRAEAARVLSVSLSTVDKLIERGRLPAYRVARTVRVRMADVLNVAVPR